MRHPRGVANTALSLLLTGLCGLPAPVPAQGKPDPGVVATYRGGQVTRADVAGWRRAHPEHEAADLSSAVEQIVLTTTLAQDAQRLGLAQDPAVRYALQWQDAKLARSALRRHVADSFRIPAAEVEARYEAVKDSAGLPHRVRLYNIFKRFAPDAGEADKQAVWRETRAIRQRLLAGEDFKALARAESDSQTRLSQGLMGNVRAGKLRPDVDAVAMALKPGEISEILSGPQGLTILYCERILAPVVRSPQELRDSARQYLRSNAFSQRWAALQRRLLAQAAVRFNWQALEAASPDPGAVLVEHSGGVLSLGQVRQLLGAKADPAGLSRKRLRSRVEAFLTARMQLREARREGLENTPGLPEKRLWKRRETFAAKALAQRIQTVLEVPTEQEVRALFLANRAAFQHQARFDLGVIVLPATPRTIRADYRAAERISHRLRTGALSFEQAARQHSAHPSASDGGRVGWVARRALAGWGIDLLRAVLRLEVGEISDFVQEGERLWILRLHGFQDRRPMRFEQARGIVENRLGQQRVEALEAEIVARWLDELDIRTPVGQ